MKMDQTNTNATIPFPQTTGGMPPLKSRLKNQSNDLPKYWKTQVSGWNNDRTFGQVANSLDDDKDSLFILGQALRQVKTRVKDQYLEVTCDTMINLYVEAQEFQKARAICKHAIKLSEEVYGPISVPPIRYEIQLSGIYYKSGHTVKALNHAYNALLRLEQIFGECHETLIPLLDKLVFLNHKMGRHREARVCGERALELIRNSENPLFEEMAITLHYYLDLIEEQSDTDESASQYFQSAPNHNFSASP